MTVSISSRREFMTGTHLASSDGVLDSLGDRLCGLLDLVNDALSGRATDLLTGAERVLGVTVGVDLSIERSASCE